MAGTVILLGHTGRNPAVCDNTDVSGGLGTEWRPCVRKSKPAQWETKVSLGRQVGSQVSKSLAHPGELDVAGNDMF